MPMAIARRTLGVLTALVASTCMLGLTATAQATGLTITSPATNGYSNNLSPTVSFTGATSGDTVTLTSADHLAADGHATAVNGAGSITPTNPVATAQNDYEYLTATETGTTSATASVYVTFDIVPDISGSGTFVDAGGVSLFGSSAIPNEPVDTTFTPLPSGSVLAATSEADSSGGTPGISPVGALVPSEYQAAMTTRDSHGIASQAATQDFFVAPAQPTISSLTDGENINQSSPNVTVSGVLAGATVALYTVDNNGDSVLLDTATASAAGNLTLTGMSALADGDDSLYAVQTVNENGTQVSSDGGTSQNTPPNSAAVIGINIDTAAPAVSFGFADAATTDDNQPYLYASNGPVDRPGNTSGVEFFVTGPDGPLNSGLVQTDGGGDASWQPTTALPDGTYSVTAFSVDDSGHVGDAQSDGASFTVDTATTAAPAPTTPAATTTAPTPTPTPTLTPTPTPTPAPASKPTPHPQAPDALTLSSHPVSAGHPVKLGFSLSKPGTVTLKLMHTVHGKSEVVGTVLVKVAKAGKHSIMLTTRFAGHTLDKGSYTLSLQAGSGQDTSTAVKTKLTVD